MCSRDLPVPLEAISILTYVSLTDATSSRSSLSFFLSGHGEKRHGLRLVTWLPKSGSPLCQKNAARAERQEV